MSSISSALCVSSITGNNDHPKREGEHRPATECSGWLGGKKAGLGGKRQALVLALLDKMQKKKCMLDQVSYVTVLMCYHHHAEGVCVSGQS